MLKRISRSLASLKLAVVLLVVLAAVLAWNLSGSGQGPGICAVVRLQEWLVRGAAQRAGNQYLVRCMNSLSLEETADRVCCHSCRLNRVTDRRYPDVPPGDRRADGPAGRGRAEKLLINDRSVVTAVSDSARGRLSTEFSFCPGPVDWPDGKSIDWGQANGRGLKVLKYYRHARERVTWVADEVDYQGPALRLELSDPAGNPVATDWLTGNLFGGEAVIGPTSYELLPITNDSLLKDFLDPPTKDLGKAGILSIHHEGDMQRVNVDRHLRQEDSPLADRVSRWRSLSTFPTPGPRRMASLSRAVIGRITPCWN